MDYERLKQRATTLFPFNIPVDVAHMDDRIASKMSARRPKDQAVYDELVRIWRRLLSGDTLPRIGTICRGYHK